MKFLLIALILLLSGCSMMEYREGYKKGYIEGTRDFGALIVMKKNNNEL